MRESDIRVVINHPPLHQSKKHSKDWKWVAVPMYWLMPIVAVQLLQVWNVCPH